MKGLFYKFLVILAGIFGEWIFVLISRGIAAGYFLLFPKRVAVGIAFYKALFPGKKWHYYLLCTFRQYMNFTSLFMDRLLLSDSDELTYTQSGWEHLDGSLKKGEGGIILMSHMGNWEAAARLLKKQEKNLRLLLYMGVSHKEEIEKFQKDDLKDNGIKVIAVDQGQGSPFDLVEGIGFLRSGGVVSMTGDIVWREDQRSAPVNFLEHRAYLPEVPHIFALLSGAPIFVFFAHKTGSSKYHFTLSEPLYVNAASRSERKHAINESTQRYADFLEKNLREHPFEWYHFKPFINTKEQ